MIDLYGVLQEQETVNGELGLGVDYYKGEQGEQGIPGKDGKDGKDGSDQVYVGADEPTDERVKLWIDTDATPPSKNVSWDEIENKPEIPAPYTLPTASTSTLGGVKVDGNTITIADGVISSVGSAEPDAYIKDASVSGNTLTLTKKDNTNVVFTSSMNKQEIHYQTNVKITKEQKAQIQKIKENPNDYDMFINDIKIIRITKIGAPVYYFGFADSPEDMRVDKFIIDYDGKFVYRGSGDIITEDNWQNYITVGGGDWNYTNDIWDSNLYNAKELIFVMGNSSSNIGSSAQCYYNFSKDSAGGETTLGGSFTNCRYYLKTESDNIYWEYTGSAMNVYNASESYYFLYKT